MESHKAFPHQMQRRIVAATADLDSGFEQSLDFAVDSYDADQVRESLGYEKEGFADEMLSEYVSTLEKARRLRLIRVVASSVSSIVQTGSLFALAASFFMNYTS